VPSAEKNGYQLPRSTVTLPDLARLLKSNEIQAVIRPRINQPSKQGPKHNPLTVCTIHHHYQCILSLWSRGIFGISKTLIWHIGMQNISALVKLNPYAATFKRLRTLAATKTATKAAPKAAAAPAKVLDKSMVVNRHQ
jgi:hypothetical protein